MVSPELVRALAAAYRRMAPGEWNRLATKLAGLSTSPDAATIREATTGLPNQDAVWLLAEAFRESGSASWSEIAAAMTAMQCLIGDELPFTELIWTGPANNRFPVRRLDQILYDLVCKAGKRIVLVTFAAHRVQLLCDHLTAALNRGVSLTLIVESESESEGQLKHDAIEAFRSVPATGKQIYCWPLAQRERNQAGRPGKLHMKCAIVDDVALVGSANLTDDAFNRNMELGILLRDPATVEAIHGHFMELIYKGTLVSAERSL